MRVLEVLFPLIAHIPLYAATYLLLLDEDGGCEELARNRITIQMQENNVFGNQVATYLTTAPEIEETLQRLLAEMKLYPIDIQTYLGLQQQIQMDAGKAAFNIRNDLNVFGHFFLWTGYLIIADVTMSIVFLTYWIFVMKPYQKEKCPLKDKSSEDESEIKEGTKATSSHVKDKNETEELSSNPTASEHL